MAYIRSYETTAKRKGKPVKRHEVVWREPHPTQPGKMRSRQESFTTREAAEARRDELNAAKHSVGGTTTLADAKKAGALPFGDYAASWLDRLVTRVADPEDTLKAATATKYKRLLEFYVLPDMGGTQSRR
jgi:integrase